MTSKGINQPSRSNGEIDGLGFYFFIRGGRINFNESISGVVGIGLGGITQQVELFLYGISFEQEDFLFTSNIYAGVEFCTVRTPHIGSSVSLDYDR